MDIFDTLDGLQDHVQQSPWIPFTQLRVVDQDLMTQLLQVAREQLERAQQEPPSEKSREEMLSQAENEGKLLVEAARHEAQEVLSDDRISSLRQNYYDEIVGEGRQRANQRMREAYAYTVERMTAIERSLRALRTQVGEGLAGAQKTTRDAEKNLRQSKKEVSREKVRARRQKVKQALF
jgi:hypothetical protein